MSDEQNKPEWLKEMSVLSLKPGDTVVIKVFRRLSEEEARQFRETWDAQFVGAEKYPILVLENADISVLRRESE